MKDRWAGNQWPSIEIDPYEDRHFLPILTHLCGILHVPLPRVVETLDGYAADLEAEGHPVTLLMDNWTFSIAFEDEALRDRVFDALAEMPDGSFAE
jgi:hypothetical protein